MAHALEVLVGDKMTTLVIPEQSEALLDDWVNNASGIGCLATVTGTANYEKVPVR